MSVLLKENKRIHQNYRRKLPTQCPENAAILKTRKRCDVYPLLRFFWRSFLRFSTKLIGKLAWKCSDLSTIATSWATKAYKQLSDQREVVSAIALGISLERLGIENIWLRLLGLNILSHQSWIEFFYRFSINQEGSANRSTRGEIRSRLEFQSRSTSSIGMGFPCWLGPPAFPSPGLGARQCAWSDAHPRLTLDAQIASDFKSNPLEIWELAAIRITAKRIFQPALWLEKALGSSGGFRREFPEGLEVALVWNFPYGML